MSPAVENQASIVAGRRQEHRSEPMRCPDPRGKMEVLHYRAGGREGQISRARDNAQHEIDESRPHPVSVFTQFRQFLTGEPSSERQPPSEPPVPEVEPKDERDSGEWFTIDLSSPRDEGKYKAPRPSPYPEDRRGRAIWRHESRVQSYWNSPFLPESQVPPAPASIRRSFANDQELEEALDREIITWNTGPCRIVCIVEGDERQAVQPQTAIIVDPSADGYVSDSETVASARTFAVLTIDSQYETSGEEQEDADQEEEDMVVQSARITRVGRATLINMPELNRIQTEDVEERFVPSGDPANGVLEQDTAQLPASIPLRVRKLC